MTNPRQIFIGDVHGHYKSLMILLDAIAPATEDQIYFLGDLIDRGPDSAQVVEFVKKSPYLCLMGNHEQLMLEAFPEGKIEHSAFSNWLYCGGQETVKSYAQVDLLYQHLEWIRSLPASLDLGNIWLAHAGVNPKLPIGEQTEQEFCWIRSEFHRMAQPYFADKLIITGHTITFTLPGVKPGQIAQGEGWLDIETGAYHPKSGWLTALDMTQQLVYQVNTLKDKTRTRPFSEAVTRVDPGQVQCR